MQLSAYMQNGRAPKAMLKINDLPRDDRVHKLAGFP